MHMDVILYNRTTPDTAITMEQPFTEYLKIKVITDLPWQQLGVQSSRIISSNTVGGDTKDIEKTELFNMLGTAHINTEMPTHLQEEEKEDMDA